MTDTAQRHTAIIDSPCGRLGIVDDNAVVTAVHFLDDVTRCKLPVSRLAEKTVHQLERFFTDPEFQFDLPLVESATAFQQRARGALRAIPVGETVSYGKLATSMASSARAVAGACRRNPVPIIVPCHRVIASSGLGGFSGALDGKPLRIKRWLLEHEHAI